MASNNECLIIVSFPTIKLSIYVNNMVIKNNKYITDYFAGLFYFGGHGIQADERLMLPVDAPKSYGPHHCLSEKEVKDVMLSKDPTVRIIILDMCLKPPDRYVINFVPNIFTCTYNNL
jgi:hypothetical protein